MAFEQAENELLTKYDPVLESPKIKSRYGAAQASAQRASSPAHGCTSQRIHQPKESWNTTPLLK
jgi:hypothetical protein